VQPLPIDSCEARPRDLIERIASALPQQVRADYYREMAHCRVLPESDEMLRILRAMQFLALLIEQAPGEVAAEREQLTRVLEESVEAVDASNRASMEYLRKLEDRIIQLPQDVSDGIRPEMVAQLICQDLRARFADVPQTVATLAGTSRQMKDASTEFQRTAEQLTGSYRGVCGSSAGSHRPVAGEHRPSRRHRLGRDAGAHPEVQPDPYLDSGGALRGRIEHRHGAGRRARRVDETPRAGCRARATGCTRARAGRAAGRTRPEAAGGGRKPLASLCGKPTGTLWGSLSTTMPLVFPKTANPIQTVGRTPWSARVPWTRSWNNDISIMQRASRPTGRRPQRGPQDRGGRPTINADGAIPGKTRPAPHRLRRRRGRCARRTGASIIKVVMHRFALFALFAATAFAQPNDPFKPKPPADVDAALRARVQEFYDLHIKGQFRKAEALVAEDTKDFFYTGNKPKYLSCDLSRIDYSENFTQAKALMVCEMYIMMPGFTDHPMKVPTPSAWKLIDGKWYWWVDQDALLNTPWGRMSPGPFPTTGAAPPPSLASLPTADSLFKQIQLDKNSVRLKAGESAEVTISNGAPGLTSLTLPAALPGVEAKLDKALLQAGGKAVLTLRAAKGAKSGVLNVQVEQTMQLLPIQITIVE
jgi:hypothetical protein